MTKEQGALRTEALRDEAIRLLHEYSALTGDRAPSKTRFDRWSRASGYTLRSRAIFDAFGDWLNALDSAGLDDPRGAPSPWNEQNIKEAFQLAVRDIGGSRVSIAQYNCYRRRHGEHNFPSVSALVRIFGSWSTGLEAVGRQRGGRDIDLEKGFDAIRRIADEIGREPTIADVEDRRLPGEPHPLVMMRHCGNSWPETKQRAFHQRAVAA